MDNLILIGIVAFLALMTFVGYKRGLVKSIFQLLSVVIVLVLVTLLTPVATKLIEKSPIQGYVHEKAQEFVEKNITEKIEGSAIIGLGEKEQLKLIDNLSVPNSIKTQLIENNNESGYKELEVTNFEEYVVEIISNYIVSSIAFVILFIIIFIAVRVAIVLLDVITKLPILNLFNKGGGALFGFAEGVVVLWIICIIATAFSSTQWAQELFKTINDNPLLALIYDNNYLEKLITNIFG